MKVGTAPVLFSSLMIAASLALAPSVARAGPPASSLDGTYVVKDAKQARKSLDAAIERTVADVNRLFRGKAREALRDKQTICGKLSLTVGDQTTTVSCKSNGRSASAPNSGARKKLQRDGKTAYLSHKVTGNQIVQTIKGDKGTRRATYALSSDGKTLTVSISLESDKLDTPLRYTVTYVRSR